MSVLNVGPDLARQIQRSLAVCRRPGVPGAHSNPVSDGHRRRADQDESGRGPWHTGPPVRALRRSGRRPAPDVAAGPMWPRSVCCRPSQMAASRRFNFAPAPARRRQGSESQTPHCRRRPGHAPRGRHLRLRFYPRQWLWSSAGLSTTPATSGRSRYAATEEEIEKATKEQQDINKHIKGLEDWDGLPSGRILRFDRPHSQRQHPAHHEDYDSHIAICVRIPETDGEEENYVDLYVPRARWWRRVVWRSTSSPIVSGRTTATRSNHPKSGATNSPCGSIAAMKLTPTNTSCRRLPNPLRTGGDPGDTDDQN